MNILIIGGTGLISTCVTRQLQDAGHEVTLYNRGHTRSRLERPARTILGDRTQYATFERQMLGERPFDGVIDMVGYVPQDVEAVRRAFGGRTRQVIFCSTVDVYERPFRQYPVRPDHPRKGANYYGQNKHRCEDILLEAHRAGAFAVTLIRPAHTYGEGAGVLHAIWLGTDLVDRMRKGKPVIVHGDGTGLWASCHADDVARAFVGAVGNAQAYGQCYNAASDEWLTWNRYYETVAEAAGAPPPRLVPIPSDLLARIFPKRCGILIENYRHANIFDTSAARADLGFRTTIPLLEGMRRTITWLDAERQIGVGQVDSVYDRVVDAWSRLGAAMERELAGLDT